MSRFVLGRETRLGLVRVLGVAMGMQSGMPLSCILAAYSPPLCKEASVSDGMYSCHCVVTCRRIY